MAINSKFKKIEQITRKDNSIYQIDQLEWFYFITTDKI